MLFPFCLFLLVSIQHESTAKVTFKVTCTDEQMIVELKKPSVNSEIYLENLKYYTDLECKPEYTKDSKAVFNLSLTDVYKCGVTRITNQITGIQTFYHNIVVEDSEEPMNKDRIGVKCVFHNDLKHNVTRRSILPAGFREQEDIEVTTTLEKNAPEPELKVSVKQGTTLINGELNVRPGTPLTMEIYLDKESAPIYGLLVSFMRVSDTKNQDEAIIFNGCSVDPFLFENFNTVDGDHLSAKFRAFKFPETTYVQFTGTVNICLEKCRGVECSNGQVGYGRKKREISGIPYDAKKVFEVTLTTFIKVDYKQGDETKTGISETRKEPKTLTLNQSDLVMLDDLFVLREAAKVDSDGKEITFYRVTEQYAAPEDVYNNYSLSLQPHFIFLIVFILVVKIFNRCII